MRRWWATAAAATVVATQLRSLFSGTNAVSQVLEHDGWATLETHGAPVRYAEKLDSSPRPRRGTNAGRSNQVEAKKKGSPWPRGTNVGGSSQVEAKKKKKKKKKKRPKRTEPEMSYPWPPPPRRNCVVHIHGIHFTGTGYTRDLVHSALGGDAFASKMTNTGKPEDEGQHLQDVYPKFAGRKKLGCSDNHVDTNVDDEDSEDEAKTPRFGANFFCPSLWPIADDKNARDRLWAEWSQHWDLTLPYLIQKTPSMDVVLLERMRVGRETFHVIVMRHPFSSFLSRNNEGERTVERLLHWLDVWTNILGQLAEGQVKYYAVAQYETMLQDEEEFSTAISSSIKRECGSSSASEKRTVDRERQSHRRLFLHRKFNSTKYLKPSEKAVARQQACQQHIQCRALVRDLEPVVSYFGYSLKDVGSFRAGGDFSASSQQGSPTDFSEQLLFSNLRPPSLELVSNMRAMWDSLKSEFRDKL